MRLIFVRHGDPDYKNDNLTEKGKREVALLTERICKWENITAFFSSPLGRARATGEPALKRMNREAEICDWLQEFPTWHESRNGEKLRTWDIMPEDFFSNPDFFSKDKWCHNDYMGEMIPKRYKEACDGIDEIVRPLRCAGENPRLRYDGLRRAVCRRVVAAFGVGYHLRFATVFRRAERDARMARSQRLL